MVIHPIKPVYDKNSKILILGSFPSVKSREEGFFYGHKQNRFWKVVSGIFEEEEPESIEEKKSLLIRNKIALWDVIQSCDIVGSSDSSISNVVPSFTILEIFVEYKLAEWPLMSAAIVLVAVPTIIIYVFLQRHIISGVTDGAVK